MTNEDPLHFSFSKKVKKDPMLSYSLLKSFLKFLNFFFDKSYQCLFVKVTKSFFFFFG